MTEERNADAPLVQFIDGIIPKNLDEIIRENRDMVELGLACADEIQALRSDIHSGIPVKDIIDDWRLISLREKQSGLVNILLLGHSQQQNIAWLTSSVVQVNLTQNCVLTKSGSCYQLGYQGDGEPPTGQLIHVCATLHQWGSGVFLGVPHFFY